MRTSTVEIGFEDSGAGAPLLLLHGWPDDASTWKGVVPLLNAAGFRTVVPYLRGFGPTRFLSASAIRDARAEALAADAIDLMSGLGIDKFAVAGHDWGARAGYALASAFPERITSLAALSIGYSPHGRYVVPPLQQSRAWWYQWFLAIDKAEDLVKADPIGFAKLQWETWAPPGWYSPADFEQVSESFRNPDWIAITLHGYRTRWRSGDPVDKHYDPIAERIARVGSLSLPTLMLQGADDGTVLAASTEGKEKFFTGKYRRVVLDGVGHFPTREAPGKVAKLLIEHFTSR